MDCQWQNSRRTVERILIEGTLMLETPARFGNGDSDGLIDMPLMLDPLEGRGLITGASLAGALRSYLREREYGYEGEGNEGSLYAQLFGGLQEKNEGAQSPLIVYDAFSEKPAATELRDGVAIDPKTRTAESDKKFDLELLEAGTNFPLRMELLVTEEKRELLLRALAIALQGFESGEIRLGARKRRGFGQCRVNGWAIYRYDLRQSVGLVAWLKRDKTEAWLHNDLSVSYERTKLDERRAFQVNATFALDGSLLIRSGGNKANEPVNVHLRSKRGGELKPVLSGTSLAGALRARALKIVNTLKGKKDGWAFVEGMFGVRTRDKKDKLQLHASRLIVSETEIVNPLDLVQSRVKIDRFTGGAYPGALFSEQPVFGRSYNDTIVRVRLELRQPTGAQIGLLLLLLKDLWTGDLPLGGESSVGRGRLRGIEALLSIDGKPWNLHQSDTRIEVGDAEREELEDYVRAFVGEVTA